MNDLHSIGHDRDECDHRACEHEGGRDHGCEDAHATCLTHIYASVRNFPRGCAQTQGKEQVSLHLIRSWGAQSQKT